MVRKKILILTGSPRLHGNSEMLAEAFQAGASEIGHVVTKIQTAQMHLSGCLACEQCWTSGCACVMQDDFQRIIPALEAADAVVLAFPLYWSSMPAQLKAVMDRLYAYASTTHRNALHIRESVLLACGECSSLDDFRDAVSVYRGIAAFMGWTMRGELLVPGVLRKGDIKETNALEQARQLGRSI